jgi:hypothetical protein
VTVQALPARTPAAVRLRLLPKYALRALGLRAVEVWEADRPALAGRGAARRG